MVGVASVTLTLRFQSWKVLGNLCPSPTWSQSSLGPQPPRWSKWEEKGEIRIQSALFRAMGRNLHLNFIIVLSLAKLCPPSGEWWVGGKIAFVILEGGAAPMPSPLHQTTGRWCSFLLLVPPISSSFLFLLFFSSFPRQAAKWRLWMQARREEPKKGEAEPPSSRVPEGSRAEQWWGQKGVSQFIPSTLAPGRPVKAGPSAARLLSEP